MYLVAPVVAAIAVASWHTPGRFVAAGDIAPFLREGLAQDVGSLWGYSLTGAGSATAEIARLPELLVSRAAEFAGFGPEIAQLVFFWAWLTGASTACIFLVRQVVSSPSAHAAVGVLAIANPLMAVNLPNPLVPAALCALGLIGGELIRAARGCGRVHRSVLATLPVSYLAINPPTLAVVVAASTVALVTTALLVRPSRRELLRHAAATVPLALVAHAWWIVPSLIVFTGGGATVEAVTDPETWSWTHVNNSVGNVATLTAHWGWGMHEYLPFSDDLDRLPISPLRWALPLLAFAAPVVVTSRVLRRVALVVVGVAVASIGIGKGLHGPAAWVNLELYRRVPGMWLLREPMSKIGPVLLLAYLTGAAITIDAVARRVRAADPRPAAAGASVLAAVVAGAMVFGHPVVAGAVAPEDRTPLPASRVAVPGGWYELAADVNADVVTGKALVLPMLPYYQATTTWGYHGAATLPRDVLNRPTLLGLPGSYFGDEAVVSGLVDAVAAATDPAHIDRALDALGVSHVIVRTDLSDSQAVRPIARPDDLLRRLTESGLFDTAVDYGVAIVLRRGLDNSGAAVFGDAATIAATAPEGVARAVASLPSRTAAVGGPVGHVDISTSVFDADAGRIDTAIRVPETARYVLRATPHSGMTGLATRSATGATIDARLALRIDGTTVAASQPMEVQAARDTGPVAAIAVNDTSVALTDQPVPIELTVGTRLHVLSETGPGQPVVAWSPVSDCNAVDDRAPDLDATIDHGVIELSADRHAACVRAAAPMAGRVLLRFDAQVVVGSSARACLWSDTIAACLWEQSIDSGDGTWQHVAEVVEVPADARLFLYADAGGAPSITRYRDVELVPLAAGPAVDAAVGLPAVEVDLTAGDHVLELAQPTDEQLGARVGVPSRVGNCNARGGASLIASAVRDDAVRLEAARDAACVHYPIASIASQATYDVAIEYRTLSSGAARWCLWLDGPNRCANDNQLLEPTAAWTEARTRVRIPDGVDGIRLFVYADGDPETSSQPTVNEYRRPTVRAAAPITVSVTEASVSSPGEAGGSTATLQLAERSNDTWQLAVHGTGPPFLLALPDAGDARWELSGLPADTSAEPTTVDGYRQAWIISGLDGQAVFTARYELARYATLARWASVAAIAALIIPWRSLRRRPIHAPTLWHRHADRGAS